MDDREWRMEMKLSLPSSIFHPPSSSLKLPADADFVAERNFSAAAFVSDVRQAEGEVIVRGAAVDDVHHLALEREIRLDAVGGRRAACGAVSAVALAEVIALAAHG